MDGYHDSFEVVETLYKTYFRFDYEKTERPSAQGYINET